MSELKKRSLTRGQLGAIVGAVAASLLVTAFLGWSITCPCDFTPGGLLFGDRAGEEIADWSFANDVSLCQIQVGGLLPYSVNLNCMATSSGGLYLSCSVCDTKRWAGVVVGNDRARMRLDGTVYPVTATRVMDPDELDRAWVARVAKLQVHNTPINPAPPVGTPRPDHWWSFRVVSR
jgi:hypothetical protein